MKGSFILAAILYVSIVPLVDSTPGEYLVEYLVEPGSFYSAIWYEWPDQESPAVRGRAGNIIYKNGDLVADHDWTPLIKPRQVNGNFQVRFSVGHPKEGIASTIEFIKSPPHELWRDDGILVLPYVAQHRQEHNPAILRPEPEYAGAYTGETSHDGGLFNPHGDEVLQVPLGSLALPLSLLDQLLQYAYYVPIAYGRNIVEFANDAQFLVRLCKNSGPATGVSDNWSFAAPEWRDDTYVYEFEGEAPMGSILEIIPAGFPKNEHEYLQTVVKYWQAPYD